ncbi:uncharacterized protein VTP21DRAFT_6920 [Calcarisporiella thermophila]|uniref:uncharacterized protein n=1 Tax=Calcarisporiella thermophila TaxID=911321 RepID=UPI0037448671
MEAKENKAHRPRQAGSKADKKNNKQNKQNNEKNPKAFAPFKGRKADKAVRRKLDLNEKKLHVPLVDRTPIEPPPIVVAVVGPPGTGKTTLIKSLVKRFTKHSLSEIKGPITVVSGKKRRLTFIECANDLNAMIDVAKIADLVLLLIDASFGFEMETFEFLNILQVHGFPRIMGVLTHLDHIKKTKTLRNTKKRLKHRFWTEIYQGAKLFYLSGVINGRYPNQEVHNLSRFISVMKFRPLIWRNTHSYMLADRMEDLTDPEAVRKDPKMDRTVTLYGYLRGTNMKQGGKVHIPGAGDAYIEELSVLTDPCPLPDKVRRSLSEKQKLIFAPMSDVGGIMYDKDAVYINVPGSFTKKAGAEAEDGDEEDEVHQGPGEKMVIDLQDAPDTLAAQLNESELPIFSNTTMRAEDLDNEEEDSSMPNHGAYEKIVTDINGRRRRKAMFAGEEDEEDDDDDDEEQGEEDQSEEEEFEDDEEVESGEDEGEGEKSDRRRAFSRYEVRHFDDKDSDASDGEQKEEQIVYAESDSDLGDLSDDDDVVEDGGELRWKSNLAERAQQMFYSKRRVNIMQLIYDRTDLTPEQIAKGDIDQEEESQDVDGEASEEQGSDDEEFFEIKRSDQSQISKSDSAIDSNKAALHYEDLDDWDDEEALESIRNRFITGSLDGDEVNGEGNEQSAANEEEEDEVYGDFEDLEAGETGAAPNGNQEEKSAEELEREALEKKKEELKRKFDAEYDGDNEGPKQDFYEEEKDKIAQQLQINREEFEDDDPSVRARVEGFRAGSYVRVLLKNMPCEFVQNFNPHYPVIVGGLLHTEENFGFVQVRIKRHRWHRKILKTNDPLIFSIGWRRFQSIPIYSLNDGTRNRMLKYTPEHMHCLATFYGPIHAPNTGVCAVQSVTENSNAAFRISATGVVLDINQSVEIVKKLKLTGTPYKIYKHTAFIRDMFNSALEVTKFEGAGIRTVSGIRGQVKKPLAKPEGHFRATFEDKILKSDIVFLRAWYPIKPRKFYNPVTSLLLADKNSWLGMRLTSQVRREQGLRAPQNPDSTYRPIERKTRRFNSLRIPKSLQSELPFASKPKITGKRTTKGYLQKRAVVLEPGERKIYTLMQQLNTLKHEKIRKRKLKQEEKRGEYLRKKAKLDADSAEKDKERRREYYRKEGKKAAASESSSRKRIKVAKVSS